MSAPLLFQPYKIRDITLPNRIVVSPLCMYSAVEGLAQPWHFAHLSTFARGKAGLVFTEATAVEARGRITPQCLGIWTDEQAQALVPITAFIESMECVPGIQLAHAGRKASTRAPFVERGGSPITQTNAGEDETPWSTVAPSASKQAGFKVIELHMAHGYLLHSFLSPLANQRDDEYGGSLQNRMRFPLEVAQAMREAWPQSLPLFVRISAIDGPEDGWSLDDSVVFSRHLHEIGVDVVDCSSGGIGGAPRFRIDDAGKPLNKSSARTPGFQVPFTRRIKAETDIKTMAVGVIIDPDQAEEILQSGGADLVALGREIMHDPFWPLHAAETLGADVDFKMWPKQYAWAVDRRSQIKSINKENSG